MLCFCFFFFKQKTAYEMRISDWSSDVCSSDLLGCGQRRFYFFFAAECFELYRNVFLVAVEILDQLLKNIFIVWTKRMPDPNLGCRRYGHRRQQHCSSTRPRKPAPRKQSAVKPM